MREHGYTSTLLLMSSYYSVNTSINLSIVLSLHYWPADLSLGRSKASENHSGSWGAGGPPDPPLALTKTLSNAFANKGPKKGSQCQLRWLNKEAKTQFWAVQRTKPLAESEELVSTEKEQTKN